MKKRANRRKGTLAVLLGVMILVLTGCCEHVWEEANCTTPKKCSECGMTEGDVSHSWREANCTAPKTCSLCGITEGDVMHNFQVTECNEVRICSLCGIEGEPIGHIWKNATCTTPKLCSVCDIEEGTALGHTTRNGECSRCKEEIDEIAYKNGFAVVTYADTIWMKEKDDFVDVYVIGTIQEISKINEVLIVDAEGEKWTVDVGTACDLSSYIGTECEVYGFSSGDISSQHKMPLINMNHEDNCIVFVDGRELHPEDFSSTQQFESKYSGGANQGGNGTVWIPTDGGTKYHSKAICSGMYNPERVAEKDAVEDGFSKCGKCW